MKLANILFYLVYNKYLELFIYIKLHSPNFGQNLTFVYIDNSKEIDLKKVTVGCFDPGTSSLKVSGLNFN